MDHFEYRRRATLLGCEMVDWMELSQVAVVGAAWAIIWRSKGEATCGAVCRLDGQFCSFERLLVI